MSVLLKIRDIKIVKDTLYRDETKKKLTIFTINPSTDYSKRTSLQEHDPDLAKKGIYNYHTINKNPIEWGNYHEEKLYSVLLNNAVKCKRSYGQIAETGFCDITFRQDFIIYDNEGNDYHLELKCMYSDGPWAVPRNEHLHQVMLYCYANTFSEYYLMYWYPEMTIILLIHYNDDFVELMIESYFKSPQENEKIFSKYYNMVKQTRIQLVYLYMMKNQKCIHFNNEQAYTELTKNPIYLIFKEKINILNDMIKNEEQDDSYVESSMNGKVSLLEDSIDKEKIIDKKSLSEDNVEMNDIEQKSDDIEQTSDNSM